MTNSANHLVFTGSTGSTDYDVSTTHGGADHWTVELSSTLDIINNTAWDGKLYPNPASSFLTIRSPRPMDEITLEDLSGRLIQRYFPAQKTTFRIPAQTLNSGTYILRIRSGQEIFTQKFIKR